MPKFHFERGRKFNCPVEIFEFVYSDWQAADKITGCHWKVTKSKNKFRGGRSGFWAEFDLVHHEYDNMKREGIFTYLVNLGGKLINGNGKLEIKYEDKEGEKTVSGQGIVDIELRGPISYFGELFKGKLNDLTDELVKYQQDACDAIVKDPEGIMKLLSKDQQNELKKHLKGTRRADIFETTLQIIPVNGKYLLSFETPNKELREQIEDKGGSKELLEEFNKLIETANHYTTASRSLETRSSARNVGQDFLREIKLLGNNLYKSYISGQIGSWLQSTFTYKAKSNIRVRIKAEGQYSLLPWELMHDGNDFLCIKSATFRVAVGGIRGSEKKDIKGILVIASDPKKDLKNVRTEAEIILNSIKAGSDVETKLLSGTDATKERVIQEIESGRYQVIHFSGHSIFDQEIAGNSYLLMEGGKHIIADELARLFKGTQLEVGIPQLLLKRGVED